MSKQLPCSYLFTSGLVIAKLRLLRHNLDRARLLKFLSFSGRAFDRTFISANHYYNQFKLLLRLRLFINPVSTETMTIQHIFSKNDCMKIQRVVSAKYALF